MKNIYLRKKANPDRAVPTSITVPPDLHKRMRKYKGRLNFSAIAADAFERVIAELEREDDVKTTPKDRS